MTPLMPIYVRRTVVGAALLAVCIGAAAVIPSTLRALGPSFEALAVGTSTSVAIDLMGDPKSRSENAVLGVSFTNLTWVDRQFVLYTAKFAADKLIFKSSQTIE